MVDLKQTKTFFSFIWVDASKSEKDEVDNNFEFEEVNELDQTERGSGGFGSSGLK